MPKYLYRQGFSLVEILVGLAIGMLAVVVILQVFSLSEKQKRISTAGGDAQSNGAIVFFQLQHDIEQAGYGFATSTLFNCNLKWSLPSGSDIATAIPMAPVTINPSVNVVRPGDNNTDTLLVMYGNTNGQPQGNIINGQAGAVNTVQMPSAFAVGDKVIVAPTLCGTDELYINSISAVAAGSITVATEKTGNVAYNIGPKPVMLAYAIRQQNLTVCDYSINDCGKEENASNSAVWIPIANNVVSMKAEYARDTSSPMDGVPDTFDQITPGSALDTSGISPRCGWARSSAIRIAIVMRSSQYDKEIVTTSNNSPTWDGNAVSSIIGIGGIITPDSDDWRHYRYKVFQTIVPIRNVNWLGVPSEC